MRHLPWLIVGILFLILAGPTLASAAAVNWGMLTLRNELLTQEVKLPATYSPAETPDNCAKAIWILQRAVSLDEQNLSAHWTLGRAALACGNIEEASRTFEELMDQAERNPQSYEDLLLAFSQSGRFEKVIELYESTSLSRPMQVISDTVALAYLEQYANSKETEWALLRQAVQLRPGDLYANYKLWQQAQETREVAAMATYGEALTYFPLEAVNPTDERLLDYATQVIPALLEDGLLSREKVLNVVSYLVWRHCETASVLQLLEDMNTQYPTEPDWSFYLAEIYHRQGNLEQAEAIYQQVLDIDPNYAQAHLRLGILAEESGQSIEAVEWYKQYHEIAPDDLLGLKKLTEMCERFECPEVATLQKTLKTRTDDHHIVSELLGVSIESVEMGSNLITNDGFEKWEQERPKGWTWSAMFSQSPFSKALFIGGYDELEVYEGSRSMRVSGLWGQSDPDLEAGRGGYWLETVSLKPNTLYLLSFYYRTRDEEMAGVWISDEHEFPFPHEHRLPNTQGNWRKIVAVGWTGEGKVEAKPLLRSWSEGDVAFDNIMLREIRLPGAPGDFSPQFELR